MKKVLPEYEFSEQQLNIVKSLASECGLLEDTVKILYGRGVRTKEEIIKFINPSREHFVSPFKMQGMSQAVELITRARDEDWCVVVYGDYDADGICSATIMGNSLRDFGIEPVLCVPERRDGYGLSKQLIDMIFEEYFPQLIITVDCGISCVKEVEYIKEQGAEVIVTDHHELPEHIPDCICINPKFNDGYIYDNLCGAGVAFKVGCALNGESAYRYLDFAAIATVADSVPLTGENRDIVYEGLKLINSAPRKCYSLFAGKVEGGINSQTLSFSVAPKINAAGRMNDARAALELFNETDEAKVVSLSAKLTAYNTERQMCCDELYKRAKSLLAKKSSHTKAILLYDEGWNTGFVGIVAARLADEYCRPVILFVRHGDCLKGSARSIENINIFEALRACESYLEEYGGHSQAAGVSVRLENFEALEVALDGYLTEKYTAADFIPKTYVCGKLTSDFTPRFAHELEMLEPFGVGNKRPMFELDIESARLRQSKTPSTHLAFRNDILDFMYFGGARYSKLMESPAPKRLIFEYNISQFRGKEYLKGLVRDVIYDGEAGRYAYDAIALNGINVLALPEVNCNKVIITHSQAEKIMADCDDFGTLFIASEYATVKKFANAAVFETDLFTPAAKSGASVVLISPQPDADISAFGRIIFLDDPSGVRLPALEGKDVFICKESGYASYIRTLSCERDSLLKIFARVSADAGVIAGANAEEASSSLNGIDRTQALFALKVFEQLSLLSFEGGKITVYRGVKSNLNNSPLYVEVRTIQGKI